MAKHTYRIGTARIGYLGQAGQKVLDTTIKSGTGLGAVFAPTWDIVMRLKREMIDWKTYRNDYIALMRQRYIQDKAAFLQALTYRELIVCCYCRDTHATTRRCHRYLLVEIFEKIAQQHDIIFEYLGEVYSSQ